MLAVGDVAELEEEAIRAYIEKDLDPEQPVPIAKLCEKLFGTRPRARRNLPREALSGVLNGEPLIYYRAGTPEARAAFLCAHEAAHRRRGGHHGTNAIVEARADLLGACLLVPRPAFEKAVKRYGHSVYELAEALGITQAAAMLRLGEVTGRPVRLLGPRERTRGDRSFDWSSVDATRALKGGLRKVVLPIKLRDENKWGLMSA